MAINYSEVGWNSGSYLGPTDFNHMDDGIKAACDQADENAEDIISINESLAKLTFEISNATLNTSQFTGSDGATTIRLWRLGRLAFGLVYVSCNSDVALRNKYVVVAQINDASFYPSYSQLVRVYYNFAITGQTRVLPTVTIDGTTYNNVIVIGHANTDAASGGIISFPITYICDGD